jgi:hypothetical protein
MNFVTKYGNSPYARNGGKRLVNLYLVTRDFPNMQFFHGGVMVRLKILGIFRNYSKPHRVFVIPFILMGDNDDY